MNFALLKKQSKIYKKYTCGMRANELDWGMIFFCKSMRNCD